MGEIFLKMTRKEKKKDKKQQEQVAKGNILIKVYMRFGAEIRQLRASYLAVEKRDNYNNLVAINEQMMHNEDIDFTQEDVYTAMNITLGVSGKDKKEAIDKIDERVDKLEKRIKAIEKHPELNKYANIWDEKRKLREFQIYKKYLKFKSDKGAYFQIEKGMRVYEYESIDGFLIPIWKGADNLSDYPDFTRKKKITMQETANINAYFDSKGGKRILINALVVVLIVTSVLFLVNVYAGFKLIEKHQELDDRIVGNAETCANQQMANDIAFMQLRKEACVSQYLELKQKQIEKVSKNETSTGIVELLPNS